MTDIFNTYKEAVENYLSNEILDENNFCEPRLFEIMKYAVLNGGKRIRPVLLLAAYDVFSNENYQTALPFACAVELIHCYSLVHDDLPAMDNDDLRRGKPTCHKKFSEFGAILAGDALLTLAFEVMLNNKTEFPYETVIKAAKIIASSSGANGMCAGQTLDMDSSYKSFDALLYTHKNKTGALIKAAVISGAILGGAENKDIEILAEFSELLGLIFQIKDDILDVTSNTATLGKPVFSDDKNKKTTFVTELGLEKCENILDEYYSQAVFALNKLGDNDNKKVSFLKSLTEYFKCRIS